MGSPDPSARWMSHIEDVYLIDLSNVCAAVHSLNLKTTPTGSLLASEVLPLNKG
jgi:hypothetical protein